MMQNLYNDHSSLRHTEYVTVQTRASAQLILWQKATCF